MKKRRKGKGVVSSKKANLNGIMERVKKVGPEHFGILSIDPSKTVVACQITNFYGETLMPETGFRKNRESIRALTQETTEISSENHIKDLIVGLEMSGTFYRDIKKALQKNWPVDLIHPFTTKQLRQPASLGIKTDGEDLNAITRAVISGYSYSEASLPPFYAEWQLFSRARRDLIKKRASTKIQAMETIEAVMPGFTAIFPSFWDSNGALTLVRDFRSADRILKSGFDGIRHHFRKENVIMSRTGIHKVLQWAGNALEPAPHTKTRHRIIRDQLEFIRRLSKKITEYEYELLNFLVKSPALVLLSLEGLNVVSASEYACELGPISNYINPKRITGRAGIFPGRSQSASVDYPDGPIVAGRNARLRAAIMTCANCLKNHNPFFKGWRDMKQRNRNTKKQQKKDTSSLIVSIASKFTRISFSMMAGNQVFKHPHGGRGVPILPKIIDFCKRNGIKPDVADKLLRAAADHLPETELMLEAQTMENTVNPGRKCSSKRFYSSPRRTELIQYLWDKIEQNKTRAKHDVKE